MESRLEPLAKSSNIDQISDLVATLRRGQDENLAVAVVEAMTTNETLFLRDRIPFEELKKFMLPQRIETRKVRHCLRIWSAASSTGQEAFSFAMALKYALPDFDS